MKGRRFEGLVTLCILVPLLLSTFLKIAVAPSQDGTVAPGVPEFPANSEVVVTAGLLVTYLVLRRKLKSK
jgi:hypothetical protein